MTHEKSGLAVGAVKPANKAEPSAAEPGAPRAGAEGNAGQHSTRRAQDWASVSQALPGPNHSVTVKGLREVGER